MRLTSGWNMRQGGKQETLEKIVERIVQALDDSASLTQDQREIADYALRNILVTCATLLGLAIASWLAGVAPASFTALATGAAFRWSMGGAHYSSPGRCIASSILGPLVMGVVASQVSQLQAHWTCHILEGLVLLSLVSTGVVIWLYSPADTENNPIPDRRKPGLRRRSFMTLALWSALALRLMATGNTALVVASSLALARQSLTVAPIGYRLFSTIETRLQASVLLGGRRR